MLEAVEVVVQSQGVAQIHADGAEDGLGGGAGVLHQLLNLLELLGGGQVVGQADARSGGQLDHAVLGEVLDAAADVAGPLVLHGVGVHVHGGEGQLVEPAGDVAVFVHVAHGLAGAHGDAQDVVLLQAHGAGQGGHVAVVGHHVGHVAEGVADGADVDVLHLGVEEILGHLEEQGGHHGAVLDVDAGGGHAHRVHPGHVLGGGLEGGDDALVVVVGILGDLGIPDHLLGEHGLPVDDGGHLPVASAGVEADAAAAQVAAHGLGIALLGGHGVAVHHLKGLLIHVGHELGVKAPLAAHAVGGLHGLINVLAAAEIDLEAAHIPQHGLDEPIHIVGVGLRHVRRAVDKGLVHGHLAAGPLHGDVQGLPGVLQKRGAELAQGQETGVQLRHVFDRHFNTQMLHSDTPSFFVGNTQSSFPYRLSVFLDLSSIFSGF